MTILTIADDAVDAALDAELRTLLSTCFTGPSDDVFRSRRWWKHPPRQRWMVRGDSGLIAHAAIHERIVSGGGVRLRAAGVCEVCVHPAHRGQGWVHRVLAALHRDAAAAGYGWAMLYGRPQVYAGSGYRVAGTPCALHDEATSQPLAPTVSPEFQIRRLREDAPDWPTGPCDLGGPVF